MANTSNSNGTQGITEPSDGVNLSRELRFWFLIVFDIPSTICTLIILFYVITDRKVRSSLKNHPLLVTLLLGFTIQTIDIPLYINFIRHSSVVPRSPSTCLIWWFVDYGMFNSGLWLMTWTAFERHILVYHNHWLVTRKARIMLHYMPLLIIVLYLFSFYIYVIYFLPCQNVYDYSLPQCDGT